MHDEDRVMMKRYIPILLALLALGILETCSAHAGTADTGNQWRDECLNKNVMIRTGCIIYARGLADGLQLAEILLESANPATCIPVKVTAEQLKEVGLLYIKNNPKDRHLEAGVLLVRAFMEAWPCNKNAER